MMEPRPALLMLCLAIATVISEKDESWSWNDNKERSGDAAEARYQVYEPDQLGSFDNDGVQLGFRPQNLGPHGPNGRPFPPSYQGNNGVLVGPGGPTGIIGRPPRLDGPSGHNGILDSLPPWIRNDPRYREYDVCKCRYSFNCPSPGLKFGYCSNDKKYCCFNSRKHPGLLGGQRYPFYPGSPHKYGPVGFAPDYYGHRRPHGNPHGGYQHPSFGDHYPAGYGGAYGHRNEFDSLRPYGYDAEDDDYDGGIYGRSLSKNQTQTSDRPTKANEEIQK